MKKQSRTAKPQGRTAKPQAEHEALHSAGSAIYYAGIGTIVVCVIGIGFALSQGGNETQRVFELFFWLAPLSVVLMVVGRLLRVSAANAAANCASAERLDDIADAPEKEGRQEGRMHGSPGRPFG